MLSAGKGHGGPWNAKLGPFLAVFLELRGSWRDHEEVSRVLRASGQLLFANSHINLLIF